MNGCVGRVLVIACGALARELFAICQMNKLDCIDFRFLPSSLHNTPHLIPQSVLKAVHQAKHDGYQNIFLGYGDCGTGGMLDDICKQENIERLPGPHCYSFFYNNEAFEKDYPKDDACEAFFLTDFLVRQFDSLVWRGLGLDKHPELFSIYFKYYKYIVYIAQTDDMKLQLKAQEIAQRMNLEYVFRLTGYGDLMSSMQAINNNILHNKDCNVSSINSDFIIDNNICDD